MVVKERPDATSMQYHRQCHDAQHTLRHDTTHIPACTGRHALGCTLAISFFHSYPLLHGSDSQERHISVPRTSDENIGGDIFVVQGYQSTSGGFSNEKSPLVGGNRTPGFS